MHSPWAAVLVPSVLPLPATCFPQLHSAMTIPLCLPCPDPVTHSNSERHSFPGSLTNGNQLMSINLISLNS